VQVHAYRAAVLVLSTDACTHVSMRMQRCASNKLRYQQTAPPAVQIQLSHCCHSVSQHDVPASSHACHAIIALVMH
jgi:hypothetical protein